MKNLPYKERYEEKEIRTNPEKDASHFLLKGVTLQQNNAITHYLFL